MCNIILLSVITYVLVCYIQGFHKMQTFKRLAVFAIPGSSLASLLAYWYISDKEKRVSIKQHILQKINYPNLQVYADSAAYASAIAHNNISYYPPGKIKSDPKSNDIPSLDHLRLVNVQIFYRHGARTPLKRIPGMLGDVEWNAENLFSNINKYTTLPCRWMNFNGQYMPESKEDISNSNIVFNGNASAGLLTKLGHEQLYNLGQRLRQNYINNLKFVDSNYNHHQIYSRCTNINRMKCSSNVLISSIFETPIKQHEDDVKEVRIAIEELGREFMFPNPRICSPLIEVINAYIKAMDTFPEYVADVDKLKKLTKIPKNDRVTVTEIYDTMKAIDAHGLPKPLSLLVDWDDWMSKFERYVHQSYNMLLNLDKHTFRHSLRWSIGPVLDTILANMRTSMTCSGFYKMHLYAIHDSTLNPLLMILGNFRAWSPFAADLVFELYEDVDKRQPWVRVLYLGKPIILPGAAGDICSMIHFMNLTARMAAPFETFCSEKHGRIPEIKFTSFSIGI